MSSFSGNALRGASFTPLLWYMTDQRPRIGERLKRHDRGIDECSRQLAASSGGQGMIVALARRKLTTSMVR
jgi:hypothetical protein